MFGIDSPELLVIAIVALVVIGPKELPGLLRTWGKWMSQMRGMASEFRGHVDEMVRQSELDEVKKQLTSAASGLDIASLDPTKEIKSAIEGGMAEGEKALADARSSLDQSPAVDHAPALPADQSPALPTIDNPLAEPESAPQVAVEPAPQIAPEPAPQAAAETPGVSQPVAAQDKPAKAAAE
jgi:sec-independent protein translocase protein TatB